MAKILMPIGDAAEVMDTLYAYYRIKEAGYEAVVAGPDAAEAAHHAPTLKAFVAEARLLEKLRHPGLVECYGVARYGRTQGTHNLYLQVATHLGIQGFIIFMFFAATLALSCHSVAQRLERIIERSAGLAKRVRGDPRRRTRFATLWHDTVFLGAVARAGRMYILNLSV